MHDSRIIINVSAMALMRKQRSFMTGFAGFVPGNTFEINWTTNQFF